MERMVLPALEMGGYTITRQKDHRHALWGFEAQRRHLRVGRIWTTLSDIPQMATGFRHC